MKYNKLKSLLYQKEITVAEFCEKLQLTRPGLQKSLDNDLLPYNKVAKCCEILGISPNEFFEWETQQPEPLPYMAAEGFSKNNTNSKELNALLNQLTVKDREIDRLLRIIEANAGVEKEKRSV
jgi:transcriptional regulator with XRE-family HTH domain